MCLVRCLPRVQSEFDCDMEFIFAYSKEVKYDRMTKEAEHEEKSISERYRREIFSDIIFQLMRRKRERDPATETAEM